MEWCNDNGRKYWEYVNECEDSSIWDYLKEVWETMKQAVERGINTEGRLPGPLNLARKAPTYYVKALATNSRCSRAAWSMPTPWR